MKKVAIFVDVQNVYYTTRQAFGRHFDYRTFWSRVTAGREVVAAIAYAIERDNEKQKAFQQILRLPKPLAGRVNKLLFGVYQSVN